MVLNSSGVGFCGEHLEVSAVSDCQPLETIAALSRARIQSPHPQVLNIGPASNDLVP